MAYYLGIDVGSSFTKAAVTQDGNLIAFDVLPSGGNYSATAERVTVNALERAGITMQDIVGRVTTGYGSASVPGEGRTFTDVTCISRGIFHEFKSARTVVDIGGQYSRVIRLDGAGRNTNFLLSERCAGGSGRFLQTIAHVLDLKLEEIGPLSLEAKNPVKFNTGCAVFAESEAISRIAEGAGMADILAGVHIALASRISVLIERMGLEKDLVVTGGGAQDTGLVFSLKELVHTGVFVPQEPHITTALGAALLAEDTSE